MKRFIAVLLSMVMVFSVFGCLFTVSFAVDLRCKILGCRYGEWTVIQEGTCTVVGVERKYCEFCHEYQSRVIGLNPDNHKNVSSYQSNEDGTHILSCEDCGQDIKENCGFTAWEYNELDGHTRTCIYCDYQEQIADCNFINPKHIDNTDTHKVTCEYCGKSKIEDCVDTENVDIKATCVRYGVKGTGCVCGNVLDGEYSDPTGIHIDKDGDGKCDTCQKAMGEESEEPANESFFDKIKAFFQKLIAIFTGK